MEQRSYRERIEDFMRRIAELGLENRVFWVLASLGLAAAILLVVRVFRMLRVLVVPAAIVVGGWLLISSIYAPIPRLSTTGPVVRNGVVAVVACGEKRGFMEALVNVPEPRTGTWATQKKGDCNVYYHHPPDATQRANRHERAHKGNTQTSVDWNEAKPVWACGRKVRASLGEATHRDFARGMRKDCGIYGSESGAEAGGEDLQ